MLEHTLLVIKINGIHLFSPNFKGHRKKVVTTREGGEKCNIIIYVTVCRTKSVHCHITLETIILCLANHVSN